MAEGVAFENDGSFLERFKRMQEQEEKAKSENESKSEDEKLKKAKKETPQTSGGEEPENKEVAEEKNVKRGPFARKKGGPFAAKLAAGKRPADGDGPASKKKKKEEEDISNPAWKAYMEEVKKYQNQTCADDSDRVRPLVK
eukprot:comp11366_c1_seq1/m.5742 comp11366_c1_seq1/g.5742  ORF comp11366_c1_seq1/g.5742 comp11366_c1_seq1/m.5742 type:complete len:141 (-) comp11366_c1_seq1:476-898(-)